MHFFRALRNRGRYLAALCSLVLAIVVLPSTAAAAVTGEQTTAVILVNFIDKPTQPITKAAAHSLVFGSVSDFYWEASYQKTFLSGDTFGWFTVPVSETNCDTAAIAREANAAAEAAGANLAAYKQVIYMFPSASACSWSGTLSIGSRGEGQVFVNGVFTYQNIAHELGHVYGLQHSDALECGSVTLGSGCTVRNYGDQADTMGNRGVHFNAFQKERLGWIGATATPGLTVVGASGRYFIETYATAGQGAKGLKIAKGTDPATGAKTWYYVEYRQPTGFDSGLNGAGNLTSGVLVHVGSVSNGLGSSVLLDMTPNSNSIGAYDVMDGALGVGSSYHDPAAAVTISLVSITAQGATVDVQLGGATAPACTRAAPTVSLSGGATGAYAGETLPYTVSVTNRDSSDCSATSFSLAGSTPAGWAGALGSSAVTISPGATTTTSFNVTSPVSAGAGTYGIGVAAASNVGSVHTTNASGSYTVKAPAGAVALSGSVGTDQAEYLRGQTVYMSMRVLSGGAPLAGATVKFSTTLPNGKVVQATAVSGSDGFARATYLLGRAKSALGNYQVRADATASGASTSANASYTVR